MDDINKPKKIRDHKAFDELVSNADSVFKKNVLSLSIKIMKYIDEVDLDTLKPIREIGNMKTAYGIMQKFYGSDPIPMDVGLMTMGLIARVYEGGWKFYLADALVTDLIHDDSFVVIAIEPFISDSDWKVPIKDLMSYVEILRKQQNKQGNEE